MLQVKEIHTYYGNIPALKGVTLSVNEGEMVALLGRNGAGKTTFLNTLSGSLKPRTGEIFFENERIDGLVPHLIARKGIAHVPEGRRVVPQLTVRENLEIGAYWDWDKRMERMERVLEIFAPLRDRLNQMGATLSGGEQQMLAIGRGLMADPKCLLLDEPSLGLAPVIIEYLFEAINTINQNGVTILLVEQNAVLALELAQRAYIIQNGILVSEGSASDMENTDLIRDAYLGLRKEKG
ncbi:MAG: ABC transporter ATP-binding protein [Deltaproteobacteria bacterium]|nr:ABC transporter ATP-binding protein [Deltaproteobacteria bacterium]